MFFIASQRDLFFHPSLPQKGKNSHSKQKPYGKMGRCSEGIREREERE
jgi:hypothetical protein